MAAPSTPPPPGTIRTPPTPKHGYADSWEPFSPRKSARISSQQTQQRANHNRTPSPRATNRTSTNTRKSSTTFSTPSVSPQKKRAPAMDSVRRAVSGSLTTESAANAADLLGIGSSKSQQKPTSTTAVTRSVAGMLPTPAKTPRKQPDEKTEAGIRAIARNLFSNESDAISSRKKKTKKYSGLTLDSFKADEVDEPIAIFTDSRDRLPELDTSEENPFYGETLTIEPVPDPTKRRSTRRTTVLIPGEGRVDVEEAVKRDDGVVYVFRGKKLWKPRDAVNLADMLEVDGGGERFTLGASDEEDVPRRVTRSSFKPRLLFQTGEKTKGKGVPDVNIETEDEEAVTDIEDHVTVENADNADLEEETEPEKTPDDIVKPGTPAAPRFAPASPPTTGRASRVSKKLPTDDTPIKRTGKRSPFDGWRRSKSSASHGAAHGQKREAEATPNESSSKRQRA
ncbi:uncharacterized protein BCR38DRAFT_439382 [Pseudomassariella vexata]|uniref:Uncharacterized protein n=1 Tax=Pseudomassariella vexata TaxID=1141098 RepID=A0A1Y2DTR5_9PEZI|nr:uncharacterized protein BCR38DRAFT_439382 [Pseudomassariella vexata]ORY62650.1 hypothetical protein BCR38DRAFT_439382 [Pseudomassariella vexata]